MERRSFLFYFFSWAHFQWWIFNQCFFRSCQVGCFGHGWNWQSIESDDVKIRCFSHFSWCFPGSWRGMLIINISLLVIVKNLFETQLERHAMFVAFGFFPSPIAKQLPTPPRVCFFCGSGSWHSIRNRFMKMFSQRWKFHWFYSDSQGVKAVSLSSPPVFSL